jgi:hypothetical protein
MTRGSHENEDSGTGPYEKDQAFAAERVAALAKLFETDDPAGPDEVSSPLYWPDLTGVESVREWDELRIWVDELMVRFPHLDHHVIPRCWYRHNGHVEALVALRDHERVAFGDSAPGTAAVDWHRAFRDIEVRLREWTGVLACGATHELRTPRWRFDNADEWDRFVSDDVLRRDQRVTNRALAE